MKTQLPSCERALSVQADTRQQHASPRHRAILAPQSRRRHATSPKSPTAWAASLTVEILDGCATLAANTFADARGLALRLHSADLRDDARLALDLANALTEIATQAHRAAELAAVAARAAAGEEGALWP